MVVESRTTIIVNVLRLRADHQCDSWCRAIFISIRFADGVFDHTTTNGHTLVRTITDTRFRTTIGIQCTNTNSACNNSTMDETNYNSTNINSDNRGNKYPYIRNGLPECRSCVKYCEHYNECANIYANGDPSSPQRKYIECGS